MNLIKFYFCYFSITTAAMKNAITKALIKERLSITYLLNTLKMYQIEVIRVQNVMKFLKTNPIELIIQKSFITSPHRVQYVKVSVVLEAMQKYI